jgi:hypothetical protein
MIFGVKNEAFLLFHDSKMDDALLIGCPKHELEIL